MLKKRVGIIIFLFAMFFLLLIVRVISVTLLPDSRLKKNIHTIVRRGRILDRNGTKLAVASSAYSFYARTDLLNKEIKDFLYTTLIKTGSFSETELQRLYTLKKFIWIKRKISPNNKLIIAKLIKELKVNKYIENDELGLIEEEGRFYPVDTTASVIGVVGTDNQGLVGLEYSFDTSLSKGYTVYSTVDAQISTIAYEELKRAMSKHKAEAGSIVIVDTKTREILAMVSYPIYNPNNIKSLTTNNIKSKATGYNYEPGSVMKQFSAAYALEKGIASPHYPRYYCPATMKIGEHTFTTSANYGYVDLTQIIQKSMNIGMVQVAKSFNRKNFRKFLVSLGFGQKPSLPLTDMEAGILRGTDNWSHLSKYMIAFGQEIGVTTLQLATAASVVAGEGIYKTPIVVNKVVDKNNKTVYSPKIETHRVFSATNSHLLLNMMRKVVSENGTAIKAKVEGVAIAGKTGTGQVAKSGGGGYSAHLYNAMFIGYAPADNPSVVIIVAINNPHSPEHTGGEVAAPIFANIVRRMIISTPYFSE